MASNLCLSEFEQNERAECQQRGDLHSDDPTQVALNFLSQIAQLSFDVAQTLIDLSLDGFQRSEATFEARNLQGKTPFVW